MLLLHKSISHHLPTKNDTHDVTAPPPSRLLLPSRNQGSMASESSSTTPPHSPVSRRLPTRSSSTTGASSSSGARCGTGLLPAPPPGGRGTDASSPAGGSADNGSIGPDGAVPLPIASDMEAAPLIASDWNWDEDALDAQLFSFLLDTPQSG